MMVNLEKRLFGSVDESAAVRKKEISYILEKSKTHYDVLVKAVSSNEKDKDFAVYNLMSKVIENIYSIEKPIGMTSSRGYTENTPSYFARILGYVNTYDLVGTKQKTLAKGVLRASPEGFALIDGLRAIGDKCSLAEHNAAVSKTFFDHAEEFQKRLHLE